MGVRTHDQKPSEATRKFPVERAVGVDALDPKDLRALLQDALRRYLPDEELAVHVARDEEIIDVMSEPETNEEILALVERRLTARRATSK